MPENKTYVKIGNGDKTMLILPGLSLKSTLSAREAIAANYAVFRNYTIYLFDDRENIKENYTLKQRADDIADEMKECGIKKACVFGASMGGMVGQNLAVYHPELVEKLFLSSTACRSNETSAGVIKTWHDLAQNDRLDQLIDDMIDHIYAPAIAEKYGNGIKAGMIDTDAAELQRFVILTEAIMEMDLYDKLNRIQCPVYATAAMGDRVLGVKGTLEIVDHLHCQSYIYGPGYGHGVYDEDPAHPQRILDFFEQ